jgi:hypothetical protein
MRDLTQSVDAAGRLPRLLRPDHPRRQRLLARTRHGALGHAVAGGALKARNSDPGVTNVSKVVSHLCSSGHEIIGGFAGLMIRRDSSYRKGTAFTEKGQLPAIEHRLPADGDFSARFVKGAYVGVMRASG